MISPKSFRNVLLGIATAVGCYTLISTLARLTSPERLAFPTDLASRNLAPAAEASAWLDWLSPVRSDLNADGALIAALQTVQLGRTIASPEQTARLNAAHARVERALSATPTRAELWLALALLDAQRTPQDPPVAEPLKMAYFTAPNDARLMPVRLDIATRFNALADADIRELARGDVRLMVMREPALRPAVISAYRRASIAGKHFLDEAVQSIEPQFLAALRG